MHLAKPSVVEVVGGPVVVVTAAAVVVVTAAAVVVEVEGCDAAPVDEPASVGDGSVGAAGCAPASSPDSLDGGGIGDGDAFVRRAVVGVLADGPPGPVEVVVDSATGTEVVVSSAGVVSTGGSRASVEVGSLRDGAAIATCWPASSVLPVVVANAAPPTTAATRAMVITRRRSDQAPSVLAASMSSTPRDRLVKERKLESRPRQGKAPYKRPSTTGAIASASGRSEPSGR